jgi:hypothetical protein
VPRYWIEVKHSSWKESDQSDKDRKVFICAKLDALNLSAGILHVPGSHDDCKNEYCDLQFHHDWMTKRPSRELLMCMLTQEKMRMSARGENGSSSDGSKVGDSPADLSSNVNQLRVYGHTARAPPRVSLPSRS